MIKDWQELKRRLHSFLWPDSENNLSLVHRHALKPMRVTYSVAQDLATGQLTLRAMSLVYTTLLSLVPLLAFTFSVLKAFGVHNQMEPFIYNFLAPLGEKGTELGIQLIEFVENVKVGVLGSLGLALLIYTVLSLLSKMEQSFNFIWRIDKSRSFAERFSEYLSVLLIGPILVFAAIGLTASMMSNELVQRLIVMEPFGMIVHAAGKLAPYLLVSIAFTFLYIFMPNTQVRLWPALIGGIIAGSLWETAGWGFGSFIIGSTKYTAIYSSFAIVLIFMVWMFVSWLILLIGASIAFYVQNPEYVGMGPEPPRISGRLQEKSALILMYWIATRYYHGRAPGTLAELSEQIRLPRETTESVLDALKTHHLILQSSDVPPRYVPSRDLERVRVIDVLEAVRSSGETSLLNLDRLPKEPAIENLDVRLQETLTESFAEITLRKLVST